MPKNVYERFADRIAATPGYVKLAAAPFMGVSMRLRQSIHKKSNDETLSVNEEWLEGSWVQVDQIVTRRRLLTPTPNPA
jgi:hypothetical protein